MDLKSRPPFHYLLLLVASCSLLGGLYGPQVPVAAAGNEDDIKSSLRVFTKAYKLVDENFAEPVNADKAIYKGAIPGMLRTLDPHSNFFDPHDFRATQEDQKGHYYGVGMTVAERNHKVIVITPFTGSPAYKAGIRPGDAIVTVNDKSTENLTTSDVADLLRGPRGTPVQVVIAREGAGKPLTLNIVRDEISRKSVAEAVWVKRGIAYMSIEQFNETTGPGVDENLKRLGENNIEGLILDLRDNPGGLLNEGVAVADHFLRKGQAIVSHHGRPASSPEKTYIARRGNGGHDYPIVVLVNRYSASAAEIVTGALQDHDRAWVLGENTFGKGLVQSVMPLSEKTGLWLTTAKYYTPSGRLIQRDYAHQSFFDYYNHKDLDTKNLQDVKMTDGGRTVYGGGGISPDEKYETPKLGPFQIQLLTRFAFFDFSKGYFGLHDTRLPQNWAPDRTTLKEFHDYLLSQKYRFTEAEFSENSDWMKRSLRKEMYVTAFGADEARRVSVESDPMVQRAVESLPRASALLESARRVIVQRMK